MKNVNYQWKRYWINPENTFYNTDQGFLEDPAGELGKYINTNLVKLEELNGVNCLILLGEPGIGKSTEIKKLFQTICEETNKYETLWLDLRDITNADNFIPKLTSDVKFKQWAEENKTLYIFMDSFDEIITSFPRFTNCLSELLTKHCENINNLYLRISCRTALWPAYLGESLENLWGKENCRRYELCPLTKGDVEVALETRGIRTQKFLSEIQKKDIASLAGKPLTLNFLIDAFIKSDGQLLGGKTEIYSKGCELLLLEHDPWKRINLPVKPELNMPQKIAVAERIAVATLLGGKPIIAIEDIYNLADAEISIYQLHGQERVDNGLITLGDSNIKEVLNTGLFSSRGEGKVGWAHQTYGEYLAARYIIRHQLPWEEVKNLLFQDQLQIGIYQCIPQLYEICAWVTNLNPFFFDNAVILDPEVLLLSDVTTLTDQQKAVLTGQLLAKLDRGELFDRWETFNDFNYKKLYYPGIEKQLLPYIKKREKKKDQKSIVVRRVAINITRACKLQALEKLLVGVALDNNDDLSIRAYSVITLAHIGSDTSRKALKSLLDTGFPDDPEDELKGSVLRALWPNYITAHEVFALITPPKQHSFYGVYQSFITEEFAKSLQQDDILVALAWVEKTALQLEQRGSPISSLSDEIIMKAWVEVSNPTVLEKVANIAYERLMESGSIVRKPTFTKNSPNRLQEAVDTQDENRRALVKQLVYLINERDRTNGKKAHILYNRSIRLIHQKDLEWLLQWLENEKDAGIQKIIAEIIANAFDTSNTQYIDLVFNARQHNSVLANETHFWFEPVELDSKIAKIQREAWADHQRWQERQQKSEKEELLSILSIDRIHELLESSEAGNMESWWRLNNALCIYEHELDNPRFEELPGWEIIDKETQIRVIECGRKFLTEQGSNPEIWLGKRKIYFPAVSGYRAIRAFYEREPEFIEKQDNFFWKRWAPIIVGLPLVSNDPENGKIIALAYKYAPDEVISTLDVLIEDDAEKHSGLFINNLLAACLDDRISKFLLNKAQQKGLNPKATREILYFLMNNNDNATKDYVKSEIKIPLPKDEKRSEAVLSAAVLLLQNADCVDWEFLWTLISKNNEFGRSLIFKLHDAPSHSLTVLQRIKETQLADLYVWLTKEFPPEEYKHPEGGGTVTPKVSIGDWRDSVLRVLMDKGTAESCRQIDRIAKTLPQYKWIRQYTLMEARRITIQKSWQPLKVEQLFRNTESIANKDSNTNISEKTLSKIIGLIKAESSPVHNFIPKGFVECFEDGNWGYIKYAGETPLKIGNVKSIPYKGLKILIDNNVGTGYRFDMFFTMIYGDKAESKLYSYSNDRHTRIEELIVNSFIKKLQKGNKLKNKMSVKIDKQREIIYLEKL